MVIENRSDLRAWLDANPAAWSQVIASRIALRVLPLAGFALNSISLRAIASEFILASLRANFIAWAAYKYPAPKIAAMDAKPRLVLYEVDGVTRENASARAAETAAGWAARVTDNVRGAGAAVDEKEAFAVHAVRAATFAARAARSAQKENMDAFAKNAFAVHAADAVAVAASAGAADPHAVWKSINDDAGWLESREADGDAHTQARLLNGQPLWLSDVRGDPKFKANIPLWVRQPFDLMANDPDLKKAGFALWIAWYRGLIPNRMGIAPTSYFGEELDIRIATQPADWWNRPAAEVNADIKKWMGGGYGVDPVEKLPTIRRFILNYLGTRTTPAPIADINQAFAEADYPVIAKSVRGQLSYLATEGKIERVRTGYYQLPRKSRLIPLPPQGHGPRLGILDGKIALSTRLVADNVGSDRGRLERYRPLVVDAVVEFLRATPVPDNPLANDPHERVRRHARTYHEMLDGPLDELDYDSLFGFGSMLLNRLAAELAPSPESDLAPLSDRQKAALLDFRSVHGPFISASEVGADAIRKAEQIERNPQEERALRNASISLAKDLQTNAALIEPKAAQVVVDATEAMGLGHQAERTYLFGIGAIRNTLIVASAGAIMATLGSIAIAASLPVAVLTSALALVVLEGTKKSKAFKQVSEPIQKLMDLLSDIDMEKLAHITERDMSAHARFLLKNEDTIRQIVGNRPELEWMHDQLNAVKRHYRP